MPDLNDIPADRIHQAQAVANARLQLYVTGRIHEQMADLFGPIVRELENGGDEALDAGTASRIKSRLMQALDEFTSDYTTDLRRVLEWSAQIPLGTLALMHEHQLLPAMAEAGIDEARHGRPLTEATIESYLLGQLWKEVVQAVIGRRGDDGANLSGRIWRMDSDARQGIDRVLVTGLTKKQSAWRTAQQLERYLGYKADCPRWTSDRLQLTPAEIAAGDTTGLLSGADCESKGVAYNALRLARNEAQVAVSAMTDALLAQIPWVTHERIMTSPGHATIDVCDEVASGGDNGDGVYPKGEVTLPIHVSCMCFKEGVVMPPQTLADRLRAWRNGPTSWAGMTNYREGLGGSLASFIGLALLAGFGVGALSYWLFTREPEL